MNTWHQLDLGDAMLAEARLDDLRRAVAQTIGPDGAGVAAAHIVHSSPEGDLLWELVCRRDEASGRFVAVPVDPGILVLYGTGIRHGDQVEATVGGMAATALYHGPQGQYLGLDQVNLELPVELAGSGVVDVRLRVDGVDSNPVTIHIR